MTPYLEDEIVRAAAEQIGVRDVERRQVIEIVDEPELRRHPEYWRKAIDWTRVRRDLREGIAVPGVRLTDRYEFVLRRVVESNESSSNESSSNESSSNESP